MGYVAYGLMTLFFGFMVYEFASLIIGSIKDKKKWVE